MVKMDFCVVLGTLSNKSPLKMELGKVLKLLIEMCSEGSLDIYKLRFYSFELHQKKIVEKTLLSIKVDDINDLTMINSKELVKKLKINHECLEQFMNFDKFILDDTIYLEVIFKVSTNSP